MTLKQITLYIILPFVVGFLLAAALVTSAYAATLTKDEWEQRIAATVVVGWVAPRCAAEYPGTYELKATREQILGAIQGEAEDAAVDQGLPNDYYFDEVVRVLKALPAKWTETPQNDRRAMCANISEAFPNILKRHVST